jgi:hypothetical protein
MTQYNSLSEAINVLQARGYSVGSSLGFKGLAAKRFKIMEEHPVAGANNPDGDVIVYAIEYKDGRKGILVQGTD